jgi:hypothetical protein
VQNLSLARIRAEAARMDDDAAQFYVRAAQASSDLDTRKLLGDGHRARSAVHTRLDSAACCTI